MNRFLHKSFTNIIDGSVPIYGSTIGALNLNPDQPIKTNTVRQLVSSNLEIAEINNLQATLDTKARVLTYLVYIEDLSDFPTPVDISVIIIKIDT